jgi:hypothetical protein
MVQISFLAVSVLLSGAVAIWPAFGARRSSKKSIEFTTSVR